MCWQLFEIVNTHWIIGILLLGPFDNLKDYTVCLNVRSNEAYLNEHSWKHPMYF